uniref:Uncharacterized protein n=1 Tax=Alexandrium catenella TaxID=2925 RepID=A0A7S1QL47_ALECA|mmetsp:Transcript_34360/g.93057  ORF Transcript_34360/g.93057 Transcript_34360/m.93057 type:complete len:198 (+) Transcript_34360:90-683(+)
MALWASIATVVAAICGVGAISLLLLYLALRWYAQQRRREAKAKKARAKANSQPAEAAAPATAQQQADAGDAGQTQRRDAAASPPSTQPWTSSRPVRGPETIKREAELKRDALHLFRKLQAGDSVEEKGQLCREAVVLYDDIPNRVGIGMASVTSGRIVFCNALMQCGGLDELRGLQDSNDPDAGTLVERVVPIIFST